MPYCQQCCGRKATPGKRYCLKCRERQAERRGNGREFYTIYRQPRGRQRYDNVGFANFQQTKTFDRDE